jgi:hypothetical protein
MELETVAGGRTVGSVVVQNNINVNPQVAVGVAVLSPNAHVNASNNAYSVQVNVAAPVA